MLCRAHSDIKAALATSDFATALELIQSTRQVGNRCSCLPDLLVLSFTYDAMLFFNIIESKGLLTRFKQLHVQIKIQYSLERLLLSTQQVHLFSRSLALCVLSSQCRSLCYHSTSPVCFGSVGETRFEGNCRCQATGSQADRDGTVLFCRFFPTTSSENWIQQSACCLSQWPIAVIRPSYWLVSWLA